MSKKVKKRNKSYQGVDAKAQGPVVHRFTATTRSPLGEWWFDHKKAIIVGGKIGGGAVVLIWLLTEAVRLIVSG